jgi:hypothetical protein
MVVNRCIACLNVELVQYESLGDIAGAWAQGHRNNNEFIIVEFDQALYPEQIDIYETYNPGAVVKVSVRNSKSISFDVSSTSDNIRMQTLLGNDQSDWDVVWRTNAAHVEVRCKFVRYARQHTVH